MGWQDDGNTGDLSKSRRDAANILAAQQAALKGDTATVKQYTDNPYSGVTSANLTPEALANEKYHMEHPTGNSLNFFKDMVIPAAAIWGGGALGAGALFGGAGAGAGAVGAGATGAGVSAGTAGAIEGGLATGGSIAGGAAIPAAMTGAAGNAATGGFLDFLSSPEFAGSFDPGASGMTAGGPGGLATGGTTAGAATSNLPFGLQSKDLAMGGLNFGLNQYLAKQAQQAGQSAANTSNAMNDPRRQPFQQAANDMVQNPQDYFKNNPFATSMADFYKNGVIPANIAKSGNTGFDTDRLGAQFATAVGGNYNALLQQLQGFGGYNQGAGYAGTNQLQGDMAANQFNAESFRGVGKAAEGIFGSPDQPKTPQQNPITGSYTVIS